MVAVASVFVTSVPLANTELPTLLQLTGFRLEVDCN